MSMSVTNLAASNEEVRVYNSPFANLGAYDLTNMIKRPGNQNDEGSGYHESFIDNSEDCLERPDLAGITRSSIDASNSMDNSSHSTFKSEKVHRSKTSPRRKAGSLMETMVDEAHERQRDRGRRMVQRLKKLTTAWENLDRKHGTKRKQLPTDEEFDRIQAQVEARREKNNNRKTWLFKSHDFAYLQEKK
ncbi:hypothetical protein DM01DRAFT_1397070 [Hesseltinella vesiculosa]|uniref:Uncharacterized protein n=1 Tax=Hesseltinella vesiculosa TaxID=101127 RepID=A0A1X2G6G6_9FUNG|nr:hypothetical protein DM01DRAFT_1397070 [Hesseltinella vesiculosa]